LEAAGGGVDAGGGTEEVGGRVAIGSAEVDGVKNVEGIDLDDGGDGLADFDAFGEGCIPVAGVVRADVGEETGSVGDGEFGGDGEGGGVEPGLGTGAAGVEVAGVGAGDVVVDFGLLAGDDIGAGGL